MECLRAEGRAQSPRATGDSTQHPDARSERTDRRQGPGIQPASHPVPAPAARPSEARYRAPPDAPPARLRLRQRGAPILSLHAPTDGQLSQPRLDSPHPFTAVEPHSAQRPTGPAPTLACLGTAPARHSHRPASCGRRAARFTLRTAALPSGSKLPESPIIQVLLHPSGLARRREGHPGKRTAWPAGLESQEVRQGCPGPQAAHRQLCGRGAQTAAP